MGRAGEFYCVVIQMRNLLYRLLFVLLGFVLPCRYGFAQFSIDLTALAMQRRGEAVLFPFDDYGVPFHHGLTLELVRAGLSEEPVLRCGPPGSPDSTLVNFYGSVLDIDGELRMWYIADGERDTMRRICYATSRDGGNTWDKPKLRLVEYGGNRDNNLVAVPMKTLMRSCTVLHEPGDPDPARRFKLYVETVGCLGYVFFSADGLRWNGSPLNPITRVEIEPSGLLRRDGLYYVVGQVSPMSQGFEKRALAILASPDFEHWTDAVAVGLRRYDIPPLPQIKGMSNNRGKQIHLGAGLWDRGNVILGLYGQWNADPQDNDRRYMKMNIGFVTSQDGLHYREPVPDFDIIKPYETGWSRENPLGVPPRLAQGQGMLNVADHTLTFNGFWGHGGNQTIHRARWVRDRLGYYAPAREMMTDEYNFEKLKPHLISCPIKLDPKGARVFLNVDKLSEHSHLTVELLDEGFRPLAGYTSAECEPIRQNGLRQPVRWKTRERVEEIKTVRVRVNWDGVRVEDPRLYAVYVANADQRH